MASITAASCIAADAHDEETIDEITSLVSAGTASSALACGASCGAGFDTYVWYPIDGACWCTASEECGTSYATSSSSSSSGSGSSSGSSSSSSTSGGGGASAGPAIGGCTADVMSVASQQASCYYTSHFDGCTLRKIGDKIECNPKVIQYHYDKTHLPNCGVVHNTKACKAYKKVLLNDPYIWEWSCRIEKAKTKCKKYDHGADNGETPLVP
jgi:hypothetical protein